MRGDGGRGVGRHECDSTAYPCSKQEVGTQPHNPAEAPVHLGDGDSRPHLRSPGGNGDDDSGQRSTKDGSGS